MGHIPSCYSTQPHCSRGISLQPQRDTERGTGCGDGVEPHNRRLAGSFCFNAFIDCGVHIRI